MKEQGQERQPCSSSQGPCSSPLSPAGWGRGWGSPPGGRPVQGAAWGKLGGRIVISVGVLLNYTTSYLSPGGAASGQTDGWTHRRGPGRVGRAGEAPAAMVSPRHGPTDTSLCAAKAPQGRFYGWVPGPRNPGPRPPPPQGTQESVPWPVLKGDPGVQAPSPILPKVPGVQAPAPSSLSPVSPAGPVSLGKAQQPGFLDAGSGGISPALEFGPLGKKAPYPPVRFGNPGSG